MSAAKHILVIDDDPDIHDAIKLILEPAGYEISCALSGPEGVDMLHSLKPDLLLLDIMLSSPSEGFHIAYELKQDEHLKTLPIIMISSIGQTMGMDFAKELGSDYIQADRFLDKPFDAATLRSAVDEVFKEHDSA